MRVDQIGRDCELEISKILLMVDQELGVTVGHYCVHVHVTSRRVGWGCTVGTFTTLGECGLSLSLGLRPMKTQSSKQEMKSN